MHVLRNFRWNRAVVSNCRSDIFLELEEPGPLMPLPEVFVKVMQIMPVLFFQQTAQDSACFINKAEDNACAFATIGSLGTKNRHISASQGSLLLDPRLHMY